MARKKRLSIDEICEESIATTAVEARQWLEGDPNRPMHEGLTEYAERFHGAGAVRLWFDAFEPVHEEDESVVLPQTLIIELPQDQPEERRLIDCFVEEQEKEECVDADRIGEDVGERYCRFTIYT